MTSGSAAPPLPPPQPPAAAARAISDAARTAADAWVQPMDPAQYSRAISQLYSILRDLGTDYLDVYTLFWEAGYDAFHLTRVAQALLPGGRPVFRDLSPRRTPEDVLASHGLHPGVAQTLDPVAGVTLVTWVP